MWKHIVLTGVAICSGLLVYAQSRKHFAVENTGEYKKIVINYSATSGTCYLSPSKKSDAFSVYGNKDIDEFNHSFDININGKICTINLKIEDKSSESISQSISNKMFKSGKNFSESIWKIFLNDDKVYDLNLKYGIGDAYIDLSSLAVENLFVNTGSADVSVGYLSGIGNQTRMDTFNVQVDLGSVQMHKLNLANANVIIAEVGFGDAFLDLSDRPKSTSYIDASVGAGNLEVLVPRSGTGIKVMINSTMLCGVKLSKSFHETESDVFVNEYYEEDAENQLIFNIEVSLGNILFKEKK